MSDSFVKHGSAPGAAAAEAAYLRWLREGSTAVGEVLELDEDANTLTIEKVDPVRPTVDAARQAGRELAAIHAMGAAAFGAPADGWDGPNFIGTRQQACEPTERWAKFYVEQRVLPFAEKARRAGNVGDGGMDVVKQACDALLEEDEDAPLARIHGDLWAGNILWTRQGAVLIDPAAHGGHAETDLAMLLLFTAPHIARIIAAYDEAAPLADGWQERVGLHQLCPVMVHALVFGGEYVGQAVQMAESYA